MRGVVVNEVDGGRLGIFFGVLVALVVAFIAVSQAANLSMVQLAPAYMFTPMVAGLAVVLLRDISLSTVGLQVGRLRWLVVAAVAPLPIAIATLALALGVPGIGFDPGVDLLPGVELPAGVLGFVAVVAIVLVLGATVNALLGFGEEFGWRGYLLWELAPLGFWKASVLIGFVWGIWHAPVILEGYNYASFPVLGVAAMTVATISFSPVYTYLVLRSRSVLSAALFHGVFNASGGLVIAYTAAGDPVLTELVASPVGAASVAVFALAAVGIALLGSPDLSREYATESDSR